MQEHLVKNRKTGHIVSSHWTQERAQREAQQLNADYKTDVYVVHDWEREEN